MKFEHMKKAFEAASELGLIILIDENEDKTTYFHFSNSVKIGYIQFSRFNEYSMSIQYKPSSKCGSGANFIDRAFYNDSTDFKKLMLDCLDYNPSSLTGGKHVFWKNFKEFTKKYCNLNKSTIYQNYSIYPANSYFIQNSTDIKA